MPRTSRGSGRFKGKFQVFGLIRLAGDVLYDKTKGDFIDSCIYNDLTAPHQLGAARPPSCQGAGIGASFTHDSDTNFGPRDQPSTPVSYDNRVLFVVIPATSNIKSNNFNGAQKQGHPQGTLSTAEAEDANEAIEEDKMLASELAHAAICMLEVTASSFEVDTLCPPKALNLAFNRLGFDDSFELSFLYTRESERRKGAASAALRAVVTCAESDTFLWGCPDMQRDDIKKLMHAFYGTCPANVYPRLKMTGKILLAVHADSCKWLCVGSTCSMTNDFDSWLCSDEKCRLANPNRPRVLLSALQDSLSSTPRPILQDADKRDLAQESIPMTGVEDEPPRDSPISPEPPPAAVAISGHVAGNSLDSAPEADKKEKKKAKKAAKKRLREELELAQSSQESVPHDDDECDKKRKKSKKKKKKDAESCDQAEVQVSAEEVANASQESVTSSVIAEAVEMDLVDANEIVGEAIESFAEIDPEEGEALPSSQETNGTDEEAANGEETTDKKKKKKKKKNKNKKKMPPGLGKPLVRFSSDTLNVNREDKETRRAKKAARKAARKAWKEEQRKQLIDQANNQGIQAQHLQGLHGPALYDAAQAYNAAVVLAESLHHGSANPSPVQALHAYDAPLHSQESEPPPIENEVGNARGRRRTYRPRGRPRKEPAAAPAEEPAESAHDREIEVEMEAGDGVEQQDPDHGSGNDDVDKALSKVLCRLVGCLNVAKVKGGWCSNTCMNKGCRSLCKSGCGQSMRGLKDNLVPGFCSVKCRVNFFKSYNMHVPTKNEGWPEHVPKRH